MKEFKSFYKTVGGNEGSHCNYPTRLDPYGCGCQHDCAYCYAKSLLNFRNLWNEKEPSAANIEAIKRKVKKIEPGTVIRIGGMTDGFQPLEKENRITYETIKEMNEHGVGQLIVTKSDLIASDEYMSILDKNNTHIQISITFAPCEKAVSVERRIKAVEKLYRNGFDVAVRLSPYIPEFANMDMINAIDCEKIIVEFLRVNHWIKKWIPLNTDAYTLSHAGYNHLPLERKVELLSKVTGYSQVSVCEDVPQHYEYWKEAVNWNKNDCCNLRCEHGK